MQSGPDWRNVWTLQSVLLVLLHLKMAKTWDSEVKQLRESEGSITSSGSLLSHVGAETKRPQSCEGCAMCGQAQQTVVILADIVI